MSDRLGHIIVGNPDPTSDLYQCNGLGTPSTAVTPPTVTPDDGLSALAANSGGAEVVALGTKQARRVGQISDNPLIGQSACGHRRCIEQKPAVGARREVTRELLRKCGARR